MSRYDLAAIAIALVMAAVLLIGGRSVVPTRRDRHKAHHHPPGLP